MVSSLTLQKTIEWVSCLPLSVALVFTLWVKLEAATQVNFRCLIVFLFL